MNKSTTIDRDGVPDPSRYPGNPTSQDGVLCDSRFFPLVRKPLRRLGQSLVEGVAESPNPGDALPGDVWSLNKFLVRNNGTQIDRRFPVVAVGSNADPQVIAGKIKRYNERLGEAVNDVIPFIKATMYGLSVGHLPRPSRGTYFPYTAFLGNKEGSESKPVEVVVIFLDKGQLEAIDSTEPNYDRVQVDGIRYPLILNSIEGYSEQLRNYVLYWSKRGVLLDSNGSPKSLDNNQESLISSLSASEPKFSKLFENWPNHINDTDESEAFADSVFDLLAKRGRVAQDSLPQGISMYQEISSLSTYDRAFVGNEISQNGTFFVTATPPISTPRSMPLVLLDREKAKSLGPYGYLSFGTDVSYVGIGPRAASLRGCVCKIVSVESPRPEREQAQLAGVDQLIRNAIGVEIGEMVSITSTKIPDSTILDLLIGSRKFHLLRQQTADISVVEQSTCLMDSTTMRIIGAVDGDRVVLYGSPTAGSKRVPKARVRVVSADDRVELRRSLAGGGLNSRYPSTDTSLGVYPDIPWIFMDADTSVRLNISGKKLQPVVARVSRASLVARYIREIFLGLLIGVLGLTYDNSGLQTNDRDGFSLGLFLLIGLITYLVIRFKIANETGAPSVVKLYAGSMSMSIRNLFARVFKLPK